MSFVPKLGAPPPEVPMAIYSLNHKPIGKSTQDRPYTTGAHVNYITRSRALGHLDGARLPVDRDGARGYFNGAEDTGRKNGRVADKLMLALPKELTAEQRHELVKGYAEEVTGGRAPWLAAHHDKGKDAANPHCHLLIRDRDPETGKRVFGTTDRGSTQRLRDLWQDHANRALERAGRPERIDARTLQAQGIEREPQVHEGPRSRAAQERGRRPLSRPRNFRNGPGARSPQRRVDYPSLDRGRTRHEFNQERPRDYWQALDDARQRDELDGLRRVHLPPDGRREAASPEPRAFRDVMQRQREARQSGGEGSPGFSVKSILRPGAPPVAKSPPSRDGPQQRQPFRPRSGRDDDERER
ncbi:MobA/MobL family protein [Rhizobium sp. Root149]|uniref:MobA/MobL family protein n=1 Tax=Rhizobium sp. Root149 TaxID=1736473 RepID=UPI0009E8CCA7|nr:MobA/MobL family protein [Rhizobium sp. Root149]